MHIKLGGKSLNQSIILAKRIMNDKNSQQRNEKKHRKLIRSPEKLSPCEFDPFYNPSLLSASANVFINTNQFQPTTNHSRSSPTKTYNDQFPPQQQFWFNNESPQHQQFSSNATLPPSSSSPSIALHRKPSITIKYSKDDDLHHTSSTSSLAHHQKISKSIDLNHPFIMTSSTISSEMKDQMSNNFLINFPGCYDVNTSSSTLSLKNQQHQQQQQIIEKNLSPFNYNDEFNNSSNVYNTTKSTDIYHQSSPVSQSSLNLNLIVNQHQQQQQQQQIIPKSICGGQIVFNSNNPFLNDNFDSITSDISGNDGNKLDNFFNIDDSNDSELLFLSDEVTTTTTIEHGMLMKENDDNLNEQDEQVLKNKREKFSNASPTMKICLVVSPPTNKLFQVSIFDCDTKSYRFIFCRFWRLSFFSILLPFCTFLEGYKKNKFFRLPSR